jgi:hypothetical protein
MKALTTKAQTTMETATIATTVISLKRLLGCAAVVEEVTISDSDSNL